MFEILALMGMGFVDGTPRVTWTRQLVPLNFMYCNQCVTN